MPPSLDWPAKSPFPDPADPLAREIAVAFACVKSGDRESLRYYTLKLLDLDVPPDVITTSLLSIHAQAKHMLRIAQEDAQLLVRLAAARMRLIEAGDGEIEEHAALRRSMDGLTDEMIAAWLRAENVGRLRHAYRAATCLGPRLASGAAVGGAA